MVENSKSSSSFDWVSLWRIMQISTTLMQIFRCKCDSCQMRNNQIYSFISAESLLEYPNLCFSLGFTQFLMSTTCAWSATAVAPDNDFTLIVIQDPTAVE